MSTLTVTLVQPDLHWQDAKANRSELGRAIAAIDQATDLVVLPEMFTTGFSMDTRGQAESMQGESIKWMRDVARDTGAAICGSLIIEDDDRYYNRFVMAQADGTLSLYDKRHLFRLAGEGDHYDSGRTQVSMTLNGWKLRPIVCYDLRFPVWSRRTRESDYDLLVCVANWPSPRHHAWQTLLRARAIENQCYVAGVNRTGNDGNGLSHSGGSALIDYLGHAIDDLGDRVATSTQTLDMAELSAFREKLPFDLDADDFRVHT